VKEYKHLDKGDGAILASLERVGAGYSRLVNQRKEVFATNSFFFIFILPGGTRKCPSLLIESEQ